MSTIDPRIPTPVHELWSAIDSEVWWLHGRWIMYRQLYGTSPERIKLLNESAGTFFNILNEVLLHDVQLSLSKLGDPAGTGSRTNMTLAALVEAFKSCGELTVVAKLEPLLDKFDVSITEIRHRRNKWIAHYDRTTMLGSQANLHQGPSRNEIELALTALRDVMNCVQLHYLESQTMYADFFMDSDGEHLISDLKRAHRYKQLVKEGVIPHGDLRKYFPGEAT
jgi:nicotinamidase-related amidase